MATMEKSIVKVENQVMDLAQLEAINTLRSKRIPKKAIRTRAGKSGKTFSYVSHTWVTKTLQNGLQNMWSFEVLGWEVFREQLTIKSGNGYKDVPSVSVAATTRLTLHLLMDVDKHQPGDQLIMDRVITEVGVIEKNQSMPTAMAVAGAVSRGLCRCVMRAFGIGLELYGDDEGGQPTSGDAWTSLKVFAINQGANWNELEPRYIEAIQSVGITRENLVDRWSEAYNILAKMLGKIIPTEEMPE
jgi:hypothetical protein